MPKISYIVNQAPVIPVSLSFDGFNPGFISSLARNPGFQRVRRRSFFTQKQDYKHPQMCFRLLLLLRACVLRKSVVKFYSLPTQCVENIAGGFA